MNHLRRFGKEFKAFLNQRHKTKQCFLYVCARHVHRLVNAIGLAVFSKGNATEFRTNIRLGLRIVGIDFQRRVARTSDEWKRPFVQIFRRKLADIVCVVKFQFLVVEHGGGFVQMLQFKIVRQFFKRVEIFSLSV